MSATTLQSPEYGAVCSPNKIGVNTTAHIDLATARRFCEDSLPSPLHRALVHPNTSLESVSGSPSVLKKSSRAAHPLIQHPATFSLNTDPSPLPSLYRLGTPSNSTIRLPSLDKFDQGVEALARAHGGEVRPWTPTTSPHPNTARRPTSSQALPSIQAYTSTVYSPQTHSPQDTDSPYGHGDSCDSLMHSQDGYPSPPLDGENRHINQKYTTEEGDFIIYAWHDKKLKWQRIKQDFATTFGRTPERTVQGLQAWYYRMNQRIPMWDKDGWLLFDNDDDLEPKHISIKCRERDSQDRPMEPLGLAQRYPERAIHYSWVSPALKRISRDWASKRNMQFRERRERQRERQRQLTL